MIEFLIQSSLPYILLSMLATVHSTLNDHEYNMKPVYIVHAVWHHFVPEPSTLFSQVPWLVLWKEKKHKIKWKEKIK